MMGAGDSRGRRTLTALTDLARGSARPPTPGELDGGLAALRARIDDGRAGRRARSALFRWSLVGTLAASAAVAAVVVRSERARRPAPEAALAYRVEGGSVVDGGYLRESGRAGIKLFFAEGTEFILEPGTRSRLRAVDASGARIAIEHGTASFQVTPSIDHRWQVDVGPFLVTVKGTVFTVSWDAAREKFELTLRHGRVIVSGPVTGGDIALSAGQRLLVDLPRGETVIRDQGAEAPAERPPAAADGSDAAATPASTASAARRDGDRRWGSALAAGHLDRILAEAERTGLKVTLDRASSEDLLALADAARYRRRMDLARDALLAERRRFPDSPHSLDAAFLLGRVEEASDRGLPRAIEWYDAYLTRAPAGTYASEALGRKMTLMNKLGGASRARPVAEEYLRRFPGGTYAGPARAFLRAP
jgi:TolA-binding protein